MGQQLEFSIVYIMGRGHSGSTVLDLILGNHEKIQSVGELTSGFRRRWERCSCHALIDECDFWGSIRQRLQQLHPKTSLDSYSKMLDYMDRFYRIPQIMTQLGLPAWVREEYDPVTCDLYSLISQQSGCPYIVDSSKEMARAYYLLMRFPNKTKIIHLVRDGRGVMWSRLRRLRAGQPFQFMRRHLTSKGHWAFMILTVLSWDIANMMGILFRLLHKDSVLQMRYEDLCKSPIQELVRIGEFLNLDMNQLVEHLEKAEPLCIEHNIGGNFIRYSALGTFTFNPDNTWREHLSLRYKLMFMLLAYPLAVYYNYLHDN